MTNPVPAESTSTLMESGWLAPGEHHPLPVLVRRGMAVRTCDNCQAGYVAAVVVDCTVHQITHLLLVQPCQSSVYHLLPVTAITGVSEAEIALAFLSQGITTLPRWSGV